MSKAGHGAPGVGERRWEVSGECPCPVLHPPLQEGRSPWHVLAQGV